MWYIIGKILGYLAVLAFIVSYQAKEKKRLLLFQTVATALLCFHYGLIQAWSGLALNLVCLARNFILDKTDKKAFQSKWWPYILAGAIVVAGVFSWEAWYSLLLIIALAVNTVFLANPNANTVRKSVLFTCPLILIYNLFVGSYSGAISESISILSAIVGLIRHGKKKKEN
jgi:hypothetical protein